MTDPALLERITRSLAFMLRHQPETFDLELDPQGFADLEDVVHALNERLGEPVEEEDVREAVRSGDRPRYEIQGTTIRALYGHSIPVEPGPSSKPPELLFVAIPERELDRARTYGLRGGRRRFLHLGLSREDALETGRRTARDYAVLVIHALDAWEEGVSFYDRQALWLAEEVPTHLIDLEGTYHDGTEPIERSHDGHREHSHSHRDRDRDRDHRRGRGHGRGGQGRDRGERRDFSRGRPEAPQTAPAGESWGERGSEGREMREGGHDQMAPAQNAGVGGGERGGEREDRGRRRGGRGRGGHRDRDHGPRERGHGEGLPPREPPREPPMERRERASAPPPPPPAVRPSPPARTPERDPGRPFGAGIEGEASPPERRSEPPRPRPPAPAPRAEPERSDDRPAFGAGL